MPRINWMEERIEKLLKEGRGSGTQAEYKPWLKVSEVPSKGLSTRIKGWKTKRVHHLLSNIETDVFYILEWSNEVIDIREQYPLPRPETINIAEELGISHPKYPRTDIYTVMTTDFLITVEEEDQYKYKAITVKPSVELEKKRNIEKLEIERSYWDSKGVDWLILTELDISKTFSQNMAWIHSHFRQQTILDDKKANILAQALNKEILKQNSMGRSNPEILTEFDKGYNLPEGTAITLLRHSLAKGICRVDMFERII
ncbi:TnsA endonuclease N-terminal domain-containing protein [Terribacillus halophilus]|uniref:TnsA endonuclease N-terminal domain-containing protein n=1 Tax=Terribacillus halophilus TaxID=361279 RepID=UPI0015C359E7|nr:TnsA endonuclease N-terminal domain-containing protein [Terribacillus halophilus]